MLNLTSENEASERWQFQPITNSRAHEEVVEQIIFAILSGAYKPGERLPNIEALAGLMKVSKPVVGEALKVLAGGKVVRALRGVKGGVVVETNHVPEGIMAIASPLRYFTLSDIVEARRPIELQIALRAAERATLENFAAMEETIERLRKHRKSAVALRINFDHQFHYTMGRIAGSPVLALYQHQILEHLFARMSDYFSKSEDVGLVIELHEETLAALRSRDIKKITQAIDHHLRPLETAMAALQKSGS